MRSASAGEISGETVPVSLRGRRQVHLQQRELLKQPGERGNFSKYQGSCAFHTTNVSFFMFLLPLAAHHWSLLYILQRRRCCSKMEENNPMLYFPHYLVLLLCYTKRNSAGFNTFLPIFSFLCAHAKSGHVFQKSRFDSQTHKKGK